MIYFDNAATSHYKSKEMIKSVSDYLLNSGSPGRGTYSLSLNAAKIVFECRCKCAKFFDCSDFNKVIFTSGITESLNIVINGLVNTTDHIITTIFEHNSVLRPLYKIGCEMTVTDGSVKSIESSIKSNTKAVILTHISNVTGDILDIKGIGNICRQRGIIFIVDSAQSAGSVKISMKEENINVLCFTGHKALHGMQGVGGFCIEGDLDICPLKVGGSGIDSFNKNHPSIYPAKFEAGTLNVPGILSVLRGIEDIENMGLESILRKKKELTHIFIEKISKINDLNIYRKTDNTCGVVSFTVKNIDSAYIADMLSFKHDICTRAGAHCAPLIHQYFKEESMVRVSFGIDNTEEEIDIFINALQSILEEY